MIDSWVLTGQKQHLLGRRWGGFMANVLLRASLSSTTIFSLLLLLKNLEEPVSIKINSIKFWSCLCGCSVHISQQQVAAVCVWMWKMIWSRQWVWVTHIWYPDLQNTKICFHSFFFKLIIKFETRAFCILMKKLGNRYDFSNVVAVISFIWLFKTH